MVCPVCEPTRSPTSQGYVTQSLHCQFEGALNIASKPVWGALQAVSRHAISFEARLSAKENTTLSILFETYLKINCGGRLRFEEPAPVGQFMTLDSTGPPKFARISVCMKHEWTSVI